MEPLVQQEQKQVRSTKLNSGLIQHPRVFAGNSTNSTFLEDAIGFSAGFLNTTFGSAAPNATVCISNATRVVEYSLEFGKHISKVSNDSWLLASNDFQMIVESIHPIFFSCY